MAMIERTAYPRFKLKLTASELKEFYTPTPVEIELAHKNALGPRPVLSFLILLKSFQRLGYFPNLKQVPLDIKEHLQNCIGVSDEQSATLAVTQRSKSLYRYHQTIRTYLDVKTYDDQALALATKAVEEVAQSKSNPADLINVALEILIKERYELPGFRVLDTLVQRIRTQVNQQYFDLVLKRLFSEERQRLDAMLSRLVAQPSVTAEAEEGEGLVPFTPEPTPTNRTAPPVNLGETTSDSASTTKTEAEAEKRSDTEWNRLKEIPQSASLTHFQQLQERYTWLLGLPDTDRFLSGLPPGKIKDFAAQAQPLKAREILSNTPARRYTLILCLIHQARVSTRDNLVETFVKRVAFFHTHAKAELVAIRQRQQTTAERLLGVLTEILRVSHNANCLEDQAAFGKLTLKVLNKGGGTETLLAECEELTAYNDNNYLPLLHRYYKSHRTHLFRLVKTLKFVATTEDKKVKNALTFLLKLEDSTEEYLPYRESEGEIELSFLSEQWRKLVITTNQSGEKKLNRRHLEICLFSYLASDLKNVDLAVTDSEKYGDYRQQLLSWADCQPLLADYSNQVGLPTDPKKLVQHLKAALTKKIEEVDAFYPENTQFLIDEKGKPTVKKMPAKTYSKNLKSLEAALKERMPSRSVLEILSNVQHYTNFTRHFGPPSGSDPKLDQPTERYLLTTFCYGTNMGPTQLVKHLKNPVTDQQLSFANYRHIDTDRLLSARADIINGYARFDLPQLWGDGSRVAADGTKIAMARNNLMSEYHIRYGGFGGIRYHFVTDHYLALFTSFITCGVWEGAYILDVFSQNKSEVKPDTVFSDTQGQNLPIFGLSYLLGIKLSPRIRNFKDLVFYRPDKTSHYKHIDSLFTDVIDWELIERHIPDLLRVVLSIKSGKILPSTLLRRLNNYSRKNKLYQAIRELGRVVRTIFLLRWLTDGEFRVEVTAQTNKVEGYNHFSAWLSFGNEGIVTENDPQEQEKRSHYLDLVADAAIYQNVVDMSRVLKNLAVEGLEFNQEDLEALSPYLTRHIKRFGEYVLDLSKMPDPWDGKLELPKMKIDLKTVS